MNGSRWDGRTLVHSCSTQQHLLMLLFTWRDFLSRYTPCCVVFVCFSIHQNRQPINQHKHHYYYYGSSVMMSAAFRAVASATCELGVGKEEELERRQNHASPVHYFFHSIYQNQPAIFRGTHNINITTRNSETCDGDSSPLRHTFDIGWDDVADLLCHCRYEYSATETTPPLFFQNGDPITDPHKLYASNPHAAYLDGCSVIINHADLHHSTIARLCDDLQQSFREKENSDLVDSLSCKTNSLFCSTNISSRLRKCILDTCKFPCSRSPR